MKKSDIGRCYDPAAGVGMVGLSLETKLEVHLLYPWDWEDYWYFREWTTALPGWVATLDDSLVICNELEPTGMPCCVLEERMELHSEYLGKLRFHTDTKS